MFDRPIAPPCGRHVFRIRSWKMECIKPRRGYATQMKAPMKASRATREDRTGTNANRPGTVVRNMPMHDQILPHLRKDIVENRWKSGERLPEPQLCKEF